MEGVRGYRGAVSLAWVGGFWLKKSCCLGLMAAE
jgi:hypothetical protein